MRVQQIYNNNKMQVNNVNQRPNFKGLLFVTDMPIKGELRGTGLQLVTDRIVQKLTPGCSQFAQDPRLAIANLSQTISVFATKAEVEGLKRLLKDAHAQKKSCFNDNLASFFNAHFLEYFPNVKLTKLSDKQALKLMESDKFDFENVNPKR